MDSIGRFLYATNLGTPPDFNGSVSAYRIGANGGLTPVTGSPFPAGNIPESVAVDVFGRFVYVVNTESGTFSAYAIAAKMGR